jgi:hypothetical protein
VSYGGASRADVVARYHCCPETPIANVSPAACVQEQIAAHFGVYAIPADTAQLSLDYKDEGWSTYTLLVVVILGIQALLALLAWLRQERR